MPPLATSSVVYLQDPSAEQAGSNLAARWTGKGYGLSALPRFHEVTVDMVVKMIGQIATIERQHGEDVALAVVEDLKRVWAKPRLSLVQ
ncbi:MAG: hypothetical protein ORN25_09180 [Caulobacteraceae bacterium]|nr:hypothetical protein [Caulobacteraceae bacterium]